MHGCARSWPGAGEKRADAAPTLAGSWHHAPVDHGSPPTTRVFVYGTLLAGESNHGLLATARLLTAARTLPTFSLHDLGSFPGLVAGGAHAILGEVYEVDAATLVALDHLEDHPRFYLRTPIVLDGGLAVETYLLPADQVTRCPRIDSGDWRTYWHAQRSRS